MPKKIWSCKIGECDFDQHGMDAPMRQAVRDAYFKLTGQEPIFIFSGWAAKLTPAERKVVKGNA